MAEEKKLFLSFIWIFFCFAQTTPLLMSVLTDLVFFLKIQGWPLLVIVEDSRGNSTGRGRETSKGGSNPQGALCLIAFKADLQKEAN